MILLETIAGVKRDYFNKVMRSEREKSPERSR